MSLRQFIATQTDQISPRFLIFHNGTNGHANIIICIISPHTQKPLVSILINSSLLSTKQSNEVKIKLKEMQWITEEDLDRETFKKRIQKVFSVDIDNPALKKQELIEPVKTNSSQFFKPSNAINKRSACVIDLTHTSPGNYPDGFSEVNKNVDVDTIFMITKEGMRRKQDVTTVCLAFKPSFGFIDASHNLQIATDDNNCALYTYNFIQVIVELLKDSERANLVYNHAESFAQNNEEAEILLKKIFQQDIKTYLPQYYDADGQEKSPDDLRDYHLRFRWNIGNTLVSSIYPEETNERCLSTNAL